MGSEVLCDGLVDHPGEAAGARVGEVDSVGHPQGHDLALAVGGRSQVLAVRARERVVGVDEGDLWPPLGQRLVLAQQELLSGLVKQVYVEADGTGYVFLTAIGYNAILVTLANANAKLALVFMDMGRIATEAQAILREDILT